MIFGNYANCYRMCIDIIKYNGMDRINTDMLKLFIIYRDLQGRWFIKRGLNRKFYENKLRLDTVEDINKELASKM